MGVRHVLVQPHFVELPGVVALWINVAVLYDHVYDVTLGPVPGEPDAYSLGVVPYQCSAA
jgi:hypothetical protein